MLTPLRLFALTAMFFACQPRAQVPITALGGRDPVALCAGTDVQGSDQLTAVHFLYLYHFADADRRATFLKDPERYAIQMGGGCGRMGPLSGKGHPERFHVHDGRIYIFASDACREGFKKAPERFVLRPREAIQGEPDALQKGRDACVRAAAHLGSNERLAALRSVRQQRQWTTEDEGKPRADSWRETMVLPDRVRRDQNWGEHRFSSVVAGAEGFFVGSNGLVQPMHATGVTELRGNVLRQPIALLRQLGDADFQAVRLGADTIDGRACDVVRIGCGDIVTTLLIATDDGAVLQQRTRERGPTLWFGELVETFSDCREVDGVRLPHRVSASFDGGAAKVTTFDSIECDVDLPSDYFAPPTR